MSHGSTCGGSKISGREIMEASEIPKITKMMTIKMRRRFRKKTSLFGVFATSCQGVHGRYENVMGRHCARIVHGRLVFVCLFVWRDLTGLFIVVESLSLLKVANENVPPIGQTM
jgi:hypothetical protein